MLVHWIWLATRQGLNKRTQYELIQRFGDPEELFRASKESLMTVPGMTRKAMTSLKEQSLDEAREILSLCRQKDIHLLTFGDAGYPRRLLGVYDPPILLYYRGKLPDWEARPIIGAVGTRKCSEYGIRSAKKLGYQLARCGGSVVSGMAEGIDAAILSGVLGAEGVPAIFLAGGVDVIYPVENRGLYNEILSHGGCVLSEQPPGTKPYRGYFPVRNRLISGISNAVLVVEAPEQSGALITARHAMEQGREIYAVPGPIDSETCKGSNALLKDGAQIAQSGWDILESYEGCYEGLQDRTGDLPTDLKSDANSVSHCEKAAHFPSKEKKGIDNSGKPPYIDVEKKPAVRTNQEQRIVDQLRSGPRLTDAVINECGLPKAEALAVMTMLEINGVLRRLPGNLMALNET